MSVYFVPKFILTNLPSQNKVQSQTKKYWEGNWENKYNPLPNQRTVMAQLNLWTYCRITIYRAVPYLHSLSNIYLKKILASIY